ncbi:MAG: divergent polysaccharide deacetylase family protein [Proteobacteria bacterium]|nr:divergent polysaccharide deacetylase family protein [Pseudomonadota bacterium]
MQDNESVFTTFLRVMAIIVLVCAMVSAGVMIWYGWGYKLKEDIDAGKVVLIEQSSGQTVVGARQAIVTPPAFQQDPAPLAEEQAITEANTDKASKEQVPVGQEEFCFKPSIAIVVSNVGLSKEAVDDALQLPKIVSLGIMPYSSDVGELVSNATSKGFEVLLNLPMQPPNYPMNDPGPYALLSNLSIAENIQRMESVLNKSGQVIGVYSPEEETFTNTASNIAPVMAELKKRNLIFVYSGGVNDDLLRKANQEIVGKTMIVNVRLDAEVDAAKIKENFKKLEGIARAHGYAIGLMHAYPLTIQLLNQWLADSDKSDVVLVPLSKLLKVQEYAEQKTLKSEEKAEQPAAPAPESGAKIAVATAPAGKQ